MLVLRSFFGLSLLLLCSAGANAQTHYPPQASTAEEPNFVWHQTLRADSIFALDPVQLLEDPVTNSVSILTSTNRQTRFIELDANSGNERWRLNFPSRDSTYDFGCIYLDGDVLHASGFVLNDPVITVSGYKIQLDISRSTGKMLGYAYSLEPSHSSKPGHIFRNDDQEYVAANIFSGTYFARFDASGQVAANQVNGSGN